MFSLLQGIILGLIQGFTELFPISSLGHSVIIPKLVGWQIDQNSSYFLSFLVATHLATALVLLGFFWKDWLRIIRGVWGSLKNREIGNNTDARLGWLLVVATIPAGISGLLLEQQLKQLFASALFASGFLALNGLLLLGAEFLRKKRVDNISNSSDSDTRISKITWSKALVIGSLQSMALLPGFSRTGATMAGGLLVGLSHEDAARFSFLLATPIIGAAALLKIPELASSGNSSAIQVALISSMFAGLAAYFSVKYLVRYFKTKTLLPFAIYCFGVGLGLFLWFVR